MAFDGQLCGVVGPGTGAGDGTSIGGTVGGV